MRVEPNTSELHQSFLDKTKADTSVAIMIGESTHASVTRALATVRRYIDVKTLNFVDPLLENNSAVGFFDAFKSVLDERYFPFCNIIGFFNDNSLMILGKIIDLRT